MKDRLERGEHLEAGKWDRRLSGEAKLQLSRQRGSRERKEEELKTDEEKMSTSVSKRPYDCLILSYRLVFSGQAAESTGRGRSVSGKEGNP